MSTWKSKRKHVKIKCEKCNNEFEKSKSEFIRSNKRGRKHFCSMKCSSNFRKKQMNNCLNCNVETTNLKFCSKSCAAKYNNKNRCHSEETRKKISESSKKRYNINFNEIEYKKNIKYCKHCNKSIPYKKRKLVFCNRECKRQYDKRNMSEYQKYYRQCQFDFALNDYPLEFNFKLVEQHGWYSPTNKKNNLNGVSRDHMISVKFGYENKIDCSLIKHPANCELMIQTENVKKHKKCSISLEELKERINEWNLSYNRLRLLPEVTR